MQDQTVTQSQGAPDANAGEQQGTAAPDARVQHDPRAPKTGAQTVALPIDGTPQQLHPSSITLHRLAGWIRAAILSGMLLMVSLFLLIVAPLLVWLGLVVVLGLLVLGLIWLAHFWPPISYQYRSYSLDELGIEIRRGVVFRQVTTVPRSRVQHTDVNQGPIERQLGLAHVVIHTAGTVDAVVTLGGLELDTAMQVRSYLVASGSGDAV
jgi:membrane protein YdbS with pleckstrin-like domain